jgi:uncharacterized protein YxjI
MVFRGRREERREERRGGPGVRPVHYRMRQKLVSIGDDYWIEDGDGRRAYKVDGKALRIRETLNFDDASGGTLLRIQQRMLRVRDTMEIEDPGGRTVARVKQAMITPLRDRMTVEIPGGEDLHVQGNLLEHEYKIEADGRPVAEVSKRWFRVADTYGVEIQPDQNDVLVLAVTTVIDQMTSPDR